MPSPIKAFLIHNSAPRISKGWVRVDYYFQHFPAYAEQRGQPVHVLLLREIRRDEATTLPKQEKERKTSQCLWAPTITNLATNKSVAVFFFSLD